MTLADGFKTQTDIDDSAMKDFKLICSKGIEYKILDGMKYFDVECWAKIANVSGTGKVRVYIQWILADIIQNGRRIWWSKLGSSRFGWVAIEISSAKSNSSKIEIDSINFAFSISMQFYLCVDVIPV